MRKLNHDNSILLVSSVKGTIHLFNTGIKDMKNLENSSFENYGMSYVNWTGLMPQYFHDQWSFSRFNLLFRFHNVSYRWSIEYILRSSILIFVLILS